jgi:uncharacterized protein (DUF1330 family)
MPKGYVIFTEVVRDQGLFDAYVQRALPTITNAGGTPIVFETAAEVIEGDWRRPQVVVVEFESVDEAHTWYRSPEYQATIPDRQAAADAEAVIVAGLT